MRRIFTTRGASQAETRPQLRELPTPARQDPHLRQLKQALVYIINLLLPTHMPRVPPEAQGEGLLSSSREAATTRGQRQAEGVRAETRRLAALSQEGAKPPLDHSGNARRKMHHHEIQETVIHTNRPQIH